MERTRNRKGQDIQVSGVLLPTKQRDGVTYETPNKESSNSPEVWGWKEQDEIENTYSNKIFKVDTGTGPTNAKIYSDRGDEKEQNEDRGHEIRREDKERVLKRN
ncbi:hypothetical protein CBL_13548 [Carabus blaptoides fortunei]